MHGKTIPYDPRVLNSPEVWAMSQTARRSPRETHSLLMEFWLWVAQECPDGDMIAIYPESLFNLFQGADQRFFAALLDLGWLVKSPVGMSIPGYDANLWRFLRRRRQIAAAIRAVDAPTAEGVA